MKRFCFAVGLLTVAFSMGVQAQILDARAEVPFDFWLGQQLMPAGGYSVSHLGSGAVLLQGEKDHKAAAAMFLAKSISRKDTQADGKLEFIRYGNVYFLSKIWNPRQREGYGIPKSIREKKLASRSVPSKTDIALATK